MRTNCRLCVNLLRRSAANPILRCRKTNCNKAWRGTISLFLIRSIVKSPYFGLPPIGIDTNRQEATGALICTSISGDFRHLSQNFPASRRSDKPMTVRSLSRVISAWGWPRSGSNWSLQVLPLVGCPECATRARVWHSLWGISTWPNNRQFHHRGQTVVASCRSGANASPCVIEVRIAAPLTVCPLISVRSSVYKLLASKNELGLFSPGGFDVLLGGGQNAGDGVEDLWGAGPENPRVKLK